MSTEDRTTLIVHAAAKIKLPLKSMPKVKFKLKVAFWNLCFFFFFNLVWCWTGDVTA